MKKNIHIYFECAFNSAYLIFATYVVARLYIAGVGEVNRAALYATLSLLIGDSLHLLPRVYALQARGIEHYPKVLGLGKFITSITMTIFYVLIWKIYILTYSPQDTSIISIVIYVLAVCRIILCLLPQNNWFVPMLSNRWSIIRNIPFVVMGAIIAICFWLAGDIGALKEMWLAIVLSFAFYMPVVIWVHKHKWVGAFMIPKTCAYIWIITMFLKV